MVVIWFDSMFILLGDVVSSEFAYKNHRLEIVNETYCLDKVLLCIEIPLKSDVIAV